MTVSGTAHAFMQSVLGPSSRRWLVAGPCCALVCIGDPAVPALRELAAAHDCELIEVPHALAAHRMVVKRLPCLTTVLVQVADAPAEALEFIRRVHGSACRMTVIAAVTVYHDRIERAVWEAGATCCLPATSPSLVERLLAEVLANES